jgi:hypothetical protein
MMDNIDQVIDKRLMALKEIEKDKIIVAKAYNKKIKAKLFQVGDLVWKTIFPLRSRDPKFGKWSSSWEGPYRVTKVIFGNAYMLQTLQSDELPEHHMRHLGRPDGPRHRRFACYPIPSMIRSDEISHFVYVFIRLKIQSLLKNA